MFYSRYIGNSKFISSKSNVCNFANNLGCEKSKLSMHTVSHIALLLLCTFDYVLI